MINGLYEKSGNFGLTREHFAAILNQIAAKYLPHEASSRERAEFYASLRVEELALARCVCRRPGTRLGNFHVALPREAV